MEHFTEEIGTYGTHTQTTVTDIRSQSVIRILHTNGARLNSFSIRTDSGFQNIIEGYVTEESLAEGRFARSGLMAPFPNRTADGIYTFEETTHTLPVNKPAEHNACHGFLMNAPFVIISSEEVEGKYVIVLEHTSIGAPGYPFPFRASVTYTFSGTTLKIATEITNTGNGRMPVGFGWHPYFTTDSPIDALSLRLSPVERIVVDNRLIPTGEKVPYHQFDTLTPIHNTAFDTGLHFLSEQREITLVDPKKGIAISVSMQDKDTAYEYVQLFIPPARTSLAIEPMTCATNALNNGWGLNVLKMGESRKASYTISVSECS